MPQIDHEEYRENHIPKPWGRWEVWRENNSGFYGKDRVKFVGGYVRAYDVGDYEEANRQDNKYRK